MVSTPTQRSPLTSLLWVCVLPSMAADEGGGTNPPICGSYGFATNQPSKAACVIPSISTVINTISICFLKQAFYLRKPISSQSGARHGVIFLDYPPG